MRASFSRSLTRTTLYRIAAGVTVIVALATGIGYGLLSREVGRRVLERLSEYVVQRAKYHASHLTLARDYHKVVKQEFLRRYSSPAEVYWVRDTPADYPYHTFEFFVASHVSHNPARVTVWSTPRGRRRRGGTGPARRYIGTLGLPHR